MTYTIIETCIGCTACTLKCPVEAITGLRDEVHVIDPELCIDCGACGAVCPPEAILDEIGDICRTFPRRSFPSRRSSRRIASALAANSASTSARSMPSLSPTRPTATTSTGSPSWTRRSASAAVLCEEACGWAAIYIDPPREMLKKTIYPDRGADPQEGEGHRTRPRASDHLALAHRHAGSSPPGVRMPSIWLWAVAPGRDAAR